MGSASRPSRFGWMPASMSRRCPSISTNQEDAPISVSGLRLMILMEQGVVASVGAQAGDLPTLREIGSVQAKVNLAVPGLSIVVDFLPAGRKFLALRV